MDIARTANLGTQLRELVTELPAAARLEEALKEPDGTPAVANLLGPPSRRALSRDRGLALLSAFAAPAATLLPQMGGSLAPAATHN